MLRLRTRKEAQPKYEPKLWYRFFEFFVRNKCNAIFIIPPGDSNDLGRHIDDAQHGDAKHKPEPRHGKEDTGVVAELQCPILGKYTVAVAAASTSNRGGK